MKPEKLEPAAVRWHGRLEVEAATMTLAESQLALATLAMQTADDFPGLLVINTFRNTDDLTRKSEAVAPNVISRAAQQNVVVMRSWDLYQLLGMKLDGKEAATSLIEALKAARGGWLLVSDGAAEFVTS